MQISELSYQYNNAIMSGNRRKAKKLIVKILKLCYKGRKLDSRIILEAKAKTGKVTRKFQKQFD